MILKKKIMIKNIIWDFDGVIIDSVPIKTEGYRRLFKDYDEELVLKLVAYHELNGGISRYKKIEYFFNILLKKEISDKEILGYANKYSILTKEELSKEKYLIEDTIAFIKKNYKNYNMHIASGADDRDLKYICDSLDLNKYFLSIQGSPMIKSEIVKEILDKNKYESKETILIGDSINDFEASHKNFIKFYGYNNDLLKSDFNYIDSFVIFSDTLSNLFLSPKNRD